MMENYLIKSSMAMIVLFVAYQLVLRYAFDHQLNRYLGMACVVFSALFPFLQIDMFGASDELPQLVRTVATSTSDLQENISSAIETDLNVLPVIYWIGVTLFAIRWLVGLTALLLMYLRFPKREHWGFKVVQLNKEISPFAFFNILFIGESKATDVELKTIALHEQAHRKQLHSLDVMILELLSIFFWFNPAMWFFKREIKAGHEYLADQHVLQHGIGTLEYQHLLFKTQTGVSLKLGSYLSNRTSLTKRFNMMMQTKQKSKQTAIWTISLFVGLMSAMLFFSGFSERPEQVDVLAKYEQGDEAMYKSIGKMITYPLSAREENRIGVVQISFTVTKDGSVENPSVSESAKGHLLNEVVIVGYAKSSVDAKGVNQVLSDECIRVVKSLGKFKPAQKDGKPVSSVLTLPFKFKLE